MLFITCRSIDSKSRPSLSILCHKKEESFVTNHICYTKHKRKLPQMFYIFKNDTGKICCELNVKKSDAKKSQNIWDLLKCLKNISVKKNRIFFFFFQIILCRQWRRRKPDCIPGCVVDEGLRLVVRETVSLKLLAGGDTRPRLFSRSTCGLQRTQDQSCVQSECSDVMRCSNSPYLLR